MSHPPTNRLPELRAVGASSSGWAAANLALEGRACLFGQLLGHRKNYFFYAFPFANLVSCYAQIYNKIMDSTSDGLSWGRIQLFQKEAPIGDHAIPCRVLGPGV